MSDELDTKTDAQISEIFAVEIAGYIKYTDGTFDDKEVDWEKERPRVVKMKELKFATSADAVMSWLEKHAASNSCRIIRGFSSRYNSEAWCVYIACHQAVSSSLARAACIALIRAKRAEKGASSDA